MLTTLALLILGQTPAPKPEENAAVRSTRALLASMVERIEAESFAGIRTAEDWNRVKPRFRRELAEMLGLEPPPPRTPLSPVITGKFERDGVVVEKVHFQSLPGLYVTANFYRPAKVDRPLPTILYGCGHSRQTENGLSLGNKTGYSHHGHWFAREGFCCLVLDTVQLGELPGEHHGTYSLGKWQWLGRGYTPAGIEAWNGIRALDWLETRPEVDRARFGMTGRSGGGAYTWWVAALDERIKAAVPVAGITDLRNHVVDRCVEGHCDCMYHVNFHRHSFARIAALVAPRPLLIANSDKDPIFPLDGVQRLHAEVRGIYRLLDADHHLGLYLTEGPHLDSQELQIGAFRWLARFLRDPPERQRPTREFPADPVRSVAECPIPRHDLRVLEPAPKLPGMINEVVDEKLPKLAEMPTVPTSPKEALRWADRTRDRLFATSLRHQPRLCLAFSPGGANLVPTEGGRRATFHLGGAGANTVLHLIGGDQPGDPAELLKARVAAEPTSRHALMSPLGAGWERWDLPKPKATALRRCFPLVGRTLEDVQVVEIRAVVLALVAETLAADLKGKRTKVGNTGRLTLVSEDAELDAVALLAAALDDRIAEVRLKAPWNRTSIPALAADRILPAELLPALVFPRRVVMPSPSAPATRARLEAFAKLGSTHGASPLTLTDLPK